MKRIAIAGAALLTAGITAPVAAQDLSQGWISAPSSGAASVPVVLLFRRAFDLDGTVRSFPVRVTADNRYILYVNGKRIAAGPSTGDVAHWREAVIDLAPYLKRGRNVIAATVWNAVPARHAFEPGRQAASPENLFASTAPLFQQSVATGFRLIGTGRAAEVSTDRPGWRVRRDPGRGFANGWSQVRGWFYVAGAPEKIDAAASLFDWIGAAEVGEGWEAAVAAPDAARRTLVEDRLPPQRYAPVTAGALVRSDLPGSVSFPAEAITVPANSSVRLLLRRETMVSAYPELDVRGGKGATIRLTWSEALYDAKRRKGDRNLVEDRKPVGITDTFLADGGTRTFSTLWWRTWRFVEIEVKTGDAPLTLSGMRAYETGYPFAQVGRFDSDDPDLRRIFDIGWRTARIDAHETYMDTAFWEQLQYGGDTRLQMLISYAVSGDPRLAEQAIDAFAGSNVDGGLMEGAYPTRGSNIIPTFSLLWIGMLDDWRMRQSNPAPVVRNLPRMREVLAWFDKYRQPSGLQGKNPRWNFVDWVGQPANDRDKFPSYGKTNESCLLSAHLLGATQQAARLEAGLGEQTRAARYTEAAAVLAKAIRARCWVAARGLFADNPDGDRFSQHMNALAVLYDVATPKEAPAILDRIVAKGRGIDAPEGVTSVSYYFAWYLAQAHAHAGLSNKYVALLQTWRDLLKLNYTTWPEERDTASASTRSDSHAWSAHPSADLLGIVAGIGPDAPGYARLKVEPALGGLQRLDAVAATPKGPVRVSYRASGNRLSAVILRPRELPGDFVWAGRRYPLRKMRSRFDIPLE